MVKESKIKELVYGKVAGLLIDQLSNLGFKYAKSKQQFVRQHGNIHQIIFLYYPTAPLIYDEDKDRLFLSFSLGSAVEVPNFDKWYTEKTGDTSRFSVRKDTLNAEIEISMDEFVAEDFYTPTPAQQFKRRISRSLSNGQGNHVIPYNELINEKLPQLAKAIVELSDIEKIFNTSPYPMHQQHISLFVFAGQIEKANELFDVAYHKFVEEIEEKQKTDAAEAIKYAGYLDGFIAKAQKLSQRSYNNPFSRSVKVLDKKGEKFELSSNIQFIESLRLDISNFSIRATHLNSSGEILLITSENKIFKFSAGGELLLEKEITPPNGFDRLANPRTGLIKYTDNFFINNYIIDKNNTVVELPLPVNKQKGKKLQNPHITDLAWSQKNEQYLVLYQGAFITYSKTGEIEKSIPVKENYYSRIIVEKEWIVTQIPDTANVLLDFAGQTIGTYEFAKGNYYYEISNSFEHLICFFYATKSQYYNLQKEKKESLWAHPTFIKDYKEILYNDINHNFGLSIARFSPDDQYIIGGADHGKYVAWTLPALERIELMPTPEAIALLKPLIRTQYPDGQRLDIVQKPEVVVLGKQAFLKNRGNGISEIMFLNNGDLFLTQLGDHLLLLWDRKFNNLAHFETQGKIGLHGHKFLTQRSKDEFVVYESV